MSLTQISTNGIKDANVNTADIADGAVTGAKLFNAAVSESKLGSLVVSTSKLSDNAVTAAKLANGAVTTAKLASGAADVVNDTTPQLGGDLDTNSHEILLDTDHKIKFGDNSELTIEHQSNGNSLIKETGSGSLIFNASNWAVQNSAGTANKISASTAGSVDLFHNGSKKLETTSGGVSVTGNFGMSGFFNGNLVPDSDSSRNLGANGTRWANVYADTLYGDGSNLTNLPASGAARNIIINGAMNVAQRNTASTGTGYATVDRIKTYIGGYNEVATYSQADVASGTTPYSLGFRKCFKIQNGNQTAADGSDYLWFRYIVEAQDIANSGWDYTNSNSNITLSFWVKSSVAQDFKGYLRSRDGTAQQYSFATGSLSANTWTKITKTIPGNSNLQFDNNTDSGLDINISTYFGTNYSDSGTTENAWGTYASSTRVAPYSSSSWWTTNDATFEVTGLQLEVGDSATDFAHEFYSETLRKCQRYYWKIAQNTFRRINGYKRHDSNAHFELQSPVPMRAAPSPTLLASGTFTDFQSNFSTTQSSPTINEWNLNTGEGLLVISSTWGDTHKAVPSWEGYSIEFNAEL